LQEPVFICLDVELQFSSGPSGNGRAATILQLQRYFGINEGEFCFITKPCRDNKIDSELDKVGTHYRATRAFDSQV